jgi:hypothetical protein
MLHRNSRFAGILFRGAVTLLTAPLFAQTTAPSAGLSYLGTIPIPNWTTSGSTQANYDLFAFNPQTRIMYVADRVNHGITAIDTRTNVVAGVLQVPGTPPPSVNGVLVVPELQLLVVTDGRANVFVYDLRVPGLAPDQYALPNVNGTDALDYDPLNRTVYVINGSAPYYMSGIDVYRKTITTQFKLPGAPELNRFNPNDGFIYQVITSFDTDKTSGVVAYDPVSNSIKATYPAPCVPHGIDIDPVANVAVLGCGTNQAQVMMSLKDGSIVKSFPDVTGTDLLTFNPNNRRFYVGASGNQSTTTGCPADTTKAMPVIGVIDAGPTGQGRLVGVQCTGRNAKLGVDTIDNFLYVGTRQYPVDPGNANNGQAGVAIFYDPAPSQPVTTNTQAILTTNPKTGTAVGTLQIYPRGRRLEGTVIVRSVTPVSAVVTLTTTVGYETLPCGLDFDSGGAYCDGPIVGDPLIGGVATMGVNGAPFAQGVITLPPR